jgi:hypothetical protein
MSGAPGSLTRTQREAAAWEVLRLCLPYVRQVHPDWTPERLLAESGILPDPTIVALIRALDSAIDQPPSYPDADHQRVIAAITVGIWSPRVIADETGISLDRVRSIIAHAGYGLQPYGVGGYGRCRRPSIDGDAVRRRISSRGQMTYRRRTYSLGKLYRGRIAWIAERGQLLQVSVGDRPTVELPREGVASF